MSESPEFWTDQHGKTWKVPTIKGRLKSRSAGHAALRDFVLWRDGQRCVECGAADDLIADHIVSRRRGGSHHPDNLRALCQSCNSRKACLVEGAGRVA